MRILVTGASGFIGGHLVNNLLKKTHNVHVLTRPSTNLGLFGTNINHIVCHEHDGSTISMIKLVEQAQPDAVIHLASLFISEHGSEDVENLINSNILLSTQLIESMTLNDVRLLINAGTSWQHYQNRNYSPVNLYAATKQAFVSLLRFYVETTNLNVINLELFDTFGPNDRRAKIFNLFDSAAKTGKPLLMSPGDQYIDPIYIDDVTNAFVVALNRLDTGLVEGEETYSVTSDSPVNLKRLAEIYEKVTGKNLNIEWGERPYRTREVMRPWSKGNSLPGWSPIISIQDGINRITQNIV